MRNITKLIVSRGALFLDTLQYRDYRFVWACELLSGMSRWMLIVGRGALVYHLSGGSSVQVGITTFAALIPILVVTPVAGLLSDRVERRKLTAIAFGSNLLLTVVLVFLTISGLIEIWHVVVISLVNGAARAFEEPVMQAMVPGMVPKAKLLNAYALGGIGRHGSRFAGPFLGGLLLTFLGSGEHALGPASTFMTASLFYALGVVLILQIRQPAEANTRGKDGALRQLLEGVGYVYQHPMLRPLIIMMAFHCSFSMAFESFLPEFAEEVLKQGGAAFSFMMMAVGLGGLIVSFSLAGVRDNRQRGWLLIIMGILSGVFSAAMAASVNLPVALVMAVLLGAFGSGYMTINQAIVQSIAPDELRGRITSLFSLHAGGLMSFMQLGNSAIAELLNARGAFLVTGLLLVVILLVMTLRFPKVRYLARTGEVPAA
jgi:MFS family permease